MTVCSVAAVMVGGLLGFVIFSSAGMSDGPGPKPSRPGPGFLSRLAGLTSSAGVDVLCFVKARLLWA